MPTLKKTYGVTGRPVKYLVYKPENIPAEILALTKDMDTIKKLYILGLAKKYGDLQMIAVMVSDTFGLKPWYSRDLVKRILEEYVNEFDRRDEKTHRALLALQTQGAIEKCIDKNDYKSVANFMKILKDIYGIGTHYNITAGKPGLTAEDTLGFSFLEDKNSSTEIIPVSVVEPVKPDEDGNA